MRPRSAAPGRSAASRIAGLLQHRHAVAFIISVGLVLRLAVAIAFPVTPISDASWYVNTASDLANGLGYRDQGLPTAFWPVGWPAALALAIALTKSVPAAVILLNLAASALIMLAMVWIGRDLQFPENATRLALLLYALYPNHVAYAGVALSELYFTALLMVAMWLLLRRHISIVSLLLCGVLFGLAVLTKPQTIVVPAGALIMALLATRRFAIRDALKRLLIVCAVMAAVLAPWIGRNHQVFGTFVFVSTNGGVGLLAGAHDEATGDHMEIQETKAFAALGIPWAERVARQVELDRAEKDAAIAWIKANPGAYVALMPVKLFRLWWKDTDGFWWFGGDYPDATYLIRPLQVLNQLFYISVLVGAFICLCHAMKGLLRRDEGSSQLLLLFAVPVFVSIISIFFTGQIRYHFAAMPYLIMAAAWIAMRSFQAVSKADVGVRNDHGQAG